MTSAIFMMAKKAGVTLGIVMLTTDMVHINARLADKQICRRMTMTEIDDAQFDILEETVYQMIREIKRA